MNLQNFLQTEDNFKNTAGVCQIHLFTRDNSYVLDAFVIGAIRSLILSITNLVLPSVRRHLSALGRLAGLFVEEHGFPWDGLYLMRRLAAHYHLVSELHP